MSNPRDENPQMRRRIRATRTVSALLVVASAGAFIAISPVVAPPATAATSSALSVSWAGDTSTAEAFQPDRNIASPHFGDFDNLQVTVSQTTGLIDQAIRVNVSGFAQTRSSSVLTGVTADNAMNFVQAMQCWGPNPLAADFNKTCQWGGRYGVEASGLGDSVYNDVAARVGPLDLDPSNPTTHDVPFITVDDQEVSGTFELTPIAGTTNTLKTYPIQTIFSPSTTNEVTSARIGADGTGFFDFETQSSDQAPHLGCGSAGHLRCWLVIVPRGTHFGGDGLQCSSVFNPSTFENYTYGEANAIQGGSPVNDDCDYFDNRIVVPLDFAPTGSACEVGATETRVVGSQLMIGAMSSWQPALCQTLNTTFSFSTNPDSIARAQVLETGAGTPGIVYSGFPVSAGGLQTDEERELLTKTKMSYAPVAISGVVIAFYAEFNGGRREELVLSPRLMAKLLTQSYKFTVPTNASSGDKSWAHLGAVNQTYTYLYQDPDFVALNPTSPSGWSVNPSLVVSGPSGADAIRQVWRWIFADQDAVDFMNGVADDWGMTVNPYYLPLGHPNAHVPWYYDANKNYIATPVDRLVGLTNLDGTPQKLTEQPLDTFPKNDESIVPFDLVNSGGITSRFDSLQFAPYADTFLTAARQAFRADPNSKSRWDGTVITSNPLPGAWASTGAQLPGQKFMLAITDTVSARRYGLSTAAVTVPNSTTAVRADTEGMTNALAALEATSLDTVKQVNPAATSATAYPMTIVTYAAVNMSKTSTKARATISDMLKQVTTTGQVPGSSTGQLPAGYVPLTAELVTQATASANQIKTYTAPTTSSNGIAQDDYESSGNFDSGDAGTTGGTDPEVTTGVDAASDDRTLATFTEPIARSGLLIALVIGFLGFLIAPVLFRGRGFL